jgi:hypothetical protein
VIQVEEFVDVKKRFKELDFDSTTTLAILPRNFVTAESKEELINEGTTSTVRVLWKQAKVHETPFEKEGERIPEAVEEAFDWIGPTIFLASSLLIQNPLLIDVAVGVIANYLTDFFKGIPAGKRNAKLDVVVETKSGSYKKIHYEGAIEGLKEVPKIARSLHDEQ